MKKFIRISREEYDEMMLCKKVVDDLFTTCDFSDYGRILYFESSNHILRVLFPKRYEEAKQEAMKRKEE